MATPRPRRAYARQQGYALRPLADLAALRSRAQTDGAAGIDTRVGGHRVQVSLATLRDPIHGDITGVEVRVHLVTEGGRFTLATCRRIALALGLRVTRWERSGYGRYSGRGEWTEGEKA